MSPLANCEVGVGVRAHSAAVVGGGGVHDVVGEGGGAVAHDVEVVCGGAVVHDVEVVCGGAVVHDAVGEGDGGGVHDVGESDGGVHDAVGEGDGVHDAVGEGDGVHDVGEGDGCVRDVVGEGDGGGVRGIEAEADVVVHTVGVGVVVEVGGETVGVGVCKVHVQNAAQEGNKVQAGNDHWVKSRHLGHHGIAMQDKENMFLSKPV